MDVVFLDLDGVVHPGEVWYERASRKICLRAPGHVLFESLHIFEAAIAPYPALKIVLSTSWVRTLGFEQTCAFFPDALQSRIIGAIYDCCSPDAWRFDRLTRYDAIALDLRRRKPKPRWLAVDDDLVGWPESERDALAWVPTALGLACTDAQSRLHARLADRFG